MYLTAFLTQELARIAQLDRDTAARRARLVRLTEAAPSDENRPVSLLARMVLAVRPAPATCTPAC
jgi:hypothetical protein